MNESDPRERRGLTQLFILPPTVQQLLLSIHLNISNIFDMQIFALFKMAEPCVAQRNWPLDH
ncbi:hypothetical protein [Comamonas fluminis]|uniref:hypothetical protein n=1 Tax=Comamonas fluminis TaxID=2796366 RepID=UPI001C480C2B|nr:hypothetical protein [Comamonas fluminis]